MSTKTARRQAVQGAIGQIKDIMAAGVTVETLEAAKAVLMALCDKAALFPRDDFPLPGDGETERTFLIHEDADGGFALYVNSGLPGQTARPHDHGGSWAIVAAIDGKERHRLYLEDKEGAGSGAENLRQMAEIVVRPGTAVSLLPEGIHSIHAENTPLLHLHLYGKGFPHQEERREFDLESGTVHRFKLEDMAFIEDAR